jgi:glutamate-1-semialdehyde 2,1-aminomutase
MSKRSPREDPQIGRSPSSLPSLRTVLIEEGRGGRCWDHSGRDYIDFVCGYGPIILGHADPSVNRAVADRLARGLLFPSRSSMLDSLLADLQQIYPSVEDAVLLKTGSEAVAAAIRLARAATGRDRVLRVGFHGWHDQLVVPYAKWHNYDAEPQPSRYLHGVPNKAYRDLVTVWQGTNFDELIALIGVESADLAAVILDPVQLCPPFAGNALRLQTAVNATGAVFVLDESKTCFRVNLGGIQGLYGLRPDMTVLSKAIANGFPLAVVGGRRGLMELVEEVKIKGTYSNELCSVAAAIATIGRLRDADGPKVLAAIGTRLLDGLNAVLASHGLAEFARAVPYHWPSMPYLRFSAKDTTDAAFKDRFYSELIAAGVLMLPEHMNYVCLAHTDDDLEQTLGRVDRVLQRIL